jgi:spore germination cell wall hydrolase CwlJ-like protein
MALGVGAGLLAALRSPSGSVTPSDAIRTLVGEASDQGLKGMVCVGEVLRLRGNIRGFDGYWSEHLNNEPEWVWRMARAAWDMSEFTHFTQGADHFYDTRAPATPSWAPDCARTYVYRDHVFCRERPRPPHQHNLHPTGEGEG